MLTSIFFERYFTHYIVISNSDPAALQVTRIPSEIYVRGLVWMGWHSSAKEIPKTMCASNPQRETNADSFKIGKYPSIPMKR